MEKIIGKNKRHLLVKKTSHLTKKLPVVFLLLFFATTTTPTTRYQNGH